MKIAYSRSDILRGALIYSSGDLAASLLSDEFLWSRFGGMVLLGATLYAFEIPNYFAWIERKSAPHRGFGKQALRTLLAILYFNPLWIARHLAFIRFFSGTAESLSFDIVRVASLSFAANVPVSVAANYLIQNRVPPGWRFFASALFSACLAVYYALSPLLFGG